MPNFSGLWTERQQMQAAGASTWPAVPGAPTIGTATAGSGSASVAFTAPSNTGYPAGITSYTATSSPGGFTGTGASSPITVSGLTNGTAYTFTVTATNATGTGPASAASNSVTPFANYIEDVFSTYLYTGNGLTQVINNGIQLGSENYGSVQFTTTGSSLLSSQTLTIGSGDFTFECWVNFSSSASAVDASIFSSTGTSTGRIAIRISNGVLKIGQLGLSWDNSASLQTWTVGTWYHVAIVRSSGTLTFYRDGVSIGSGSNSVNYVTTSGTEIGSLEPSYSGYDFPGYLSQMRISTIAVYTSTFTPPTSPLTALPSTIMLTCQGSSANAGSTPMSFTASSVTLSTSSPFTVVAGYGGMTWLKYRSGSASSTYHHVYDSARGKSGNTSYNYLYPNATSPQGTGAYGPTSFNSNGFSLNSYLNESTITYVSWTFRKQPKFFDVVTYTGDGSTNRSISHSLGSIPGCIIIKRTDSTSDWGVMSRQDGGAADTYFTGLKLDTTDTNSGIYSFAGDLTSTTFKPWVDPAAGLAAYNVNGATYVAYLFAHNAGGFGLTGTDNVISCGSYTGNGSTTGPTVTLGYEPQWLLIKKAGSSGYNRGWYLFDNMRGMPVGGTPPLLSANTSNAEDLNNGNLFDITATGFNLKSSAPSVNESGIDYIYIAIRRGPMKVPTSGTTVFQTGQNLSSIGSQVNGTVGPIDMTMQTQIPTPLSGYHFTTFDRLRGQSYIATAYTNGQAGGQVYFDTNVGVRNGPWFTSGGIWYNFARAPNFFDEVCYTGTGTTIARTHNLGVAPELMIVKCTSNTGYWITYAASLGNTTYLSLSQTNAASPDGGYFWNSTSPTSTQFTAAAPDLSYSGYTYVAYLFATCPGVSKVGSYTGTGTLTTINCGFTGGARWLMIKRTDSTSNWYVWDTVSGMVAGTDPSLSLNTPTAQANANSVYTIATGFQLLASPSADVNTNGGSYIYLAIA